MRKILMAGMSLAMMGCSVSNHPTVYIDDAFSDFMMQGVTDGMNNWEEHVSALHFSPVIVTHAEAMRMGSDRPSNSIVFIKVSGFGDDNHECTDSGNVQSFLNDDKKAIAVTSTSPMSSAAIVCVWQDLVQKNYSKGYYNAYISAMIHEIGHAYKLVHDPNYNTIMYKSIGHQPKDLTCRDLTQFAMLHPEWLEIPHCQD